MKVILALALMMTLSPLGAQAADDGFGDRYFTAQAPAALGDNTQAVAVSDADAVANIEPAAGGNVSILPEDPAQKGRFMPEPSPADPTLANDETAPDDIE